MSERNGQRQYRLSKRLWHYQMVRLDHDDAQALRNLAERKSTSVAELIRTYVAWGLENDYGARALTRPSETQAMVGAPQCLRWAHACASPARSRMLLRRGAGKLQPTTPVARGARGTGGFCSASFWRKEFLKIQPLRGSRIRG